MNAIGLRGARIPSPLGSATGFKTSFFLSVSQGVGLEEIFLKPSIMGFGTFQNFGTEAHTLASAGNLSS